MANWFEMAIMEHEEVKTYTNAYDFSTFVSQWKSRKEKGSN